MARQRVVMVGDVDPVTSRAVVVIIDPAPGGEVVFKWFENSQAVEEFKRLMIMSPRAH